MTIRFFLRAMAGLPVSAVSLGLLGKAVATGHEMGFILLFFGLLLPIAGGFVAYKLGRGSYRLALCFALLAAAFCLLPQFMVFRTAGFLWCWPTLAGCGIGMGAAGLARRMAKR